LVRTFKGQLLKKFKCPKAKEKSEMKRFEELWNGSIRRVMGLDGEVKSTRGLGYNSEDDILGPNEYVNNFFESRRVACHMVTTGSKQEETLSLNPTLPPKKRKPMEDIPSIKETSEEDAHVSSSKNMVNPRFSITITGLRSSPITR